MPSAAGELKFFSVYEIMSPITEYIAQYFNRYWCVVNLNGGLIGNFYIPLNGYGE